MTGMSMFGKMSAGVHRITAGLRTRMRIARTINVYGRLSASRTIHMEFVLPARSAAREDLQRPRISSGFPALLCAFGWRTRDVRFRQDRFLLLRMGRMNSYHIQYAH